MQLVDGQAPQQCQERHEESLSSFQGDIVSDREGEGSVRKSTPGAHSPSDPQAFGGGVPPASGSRTGVVALLPQSHPL